MQIKSGHSEVIRRARDRPNGWDQTVRPLQIDRTCTAKLIVTQTPRYDTSDMPPTNSVTLLV